MESPIIQVCNMNDCDYVLKFSGEWEEERFIKMGKAGLSPRFIESFPCGDDLAIILEKMDGDLSDFLYPPQKILDEIFPKVFDIIYRMIVDYNVCQNDAKVNNFLWKKTDKGLKIYITDFGMATDCLEEEDFLNKSELQKLLRDHMSAFNNSYVNPSFYGVKIPKNLGIDTQYGNLITTDPNTNKIDWVKTFLKSEEKALKKDKNWSQFFDSVKFFDYGNLLYPEA
jgi:hypothetical protein